MLLTPKSSKRNLVHFPPQSTSRVLNLADKMMLVATERVDLPVPPLLPDINAIIVGISS